MRAIDAKKKEKKRRKKRKKERKKKNKEKKNAFYKSGVPHHLFSISWAYCEYLWGHQCHATEMSEEDGKEDGDGKDRE